MEGPVGHCEDCVFYFDEKLEQEDQSRGLIGSHLHFKTITFAIILRIKSDSTRKRPGCQQENFTITQRRQTVARSKEATVEVAGSDQVVLEMP